MNLIYLTIIGGFIPLILIYKPQYISPDAEVSDSLVNEGCTVEGNVSKSVLFQGVKVKKGAVIKESVIMPEAVIGENVFIERAIVPSHLNIPDNTIIKCNQVKKMFYW